MLWSLSVNSAKERLAMKYENISSARRITLKRLSILPMFVLICLVTFWPSGGLHAQVISHGVVLSWVAANPAPPTYNIKRSTSSGNEVTIASVSGAIDTYKDSTVAPGGIYFYVVTSLDATYAVPESLPSNEVSVTFLLPGRPTGPSGLTDVVN